MTNRILELNFDVFAAMKAVDLSKPAKEVTLGPGEKIFADLRSHEELHRFGRVVEQLHRDYRSALDDYVKRQITHGHEHTAGKGLTETCEALSHLRKSVIRKEEFFRAGLDIFWSFIKLRFGDQDKNCGLKYENDLVIAVPLSELKEEDLFQELQDLEIELDLNPDLRIKIEQIVASFVDDLGM